MVSSFKLLMGILFTFNKLSQLPKQGDTVRLADKGKLSQIFIYLLNLPMIIDLREGKTNPFY